MTLKLCKDHAQESNRSHYDRCNCNYCILEKKLKLVIETLKRFAIEEVCIGAVNDCPYCISDKPHPLNPDTVKLIAKLEEVK